MTMKRNLPTVFRTFIALLKGGRLSSVYEGPSRESIFD